MTDLAERYGAPAPWRRRTVLVAAATVVVLFGGWLAWTISEQSRPTVSSGELTFEIVDDRSVEATFTIDVRDTTSEPSCTLKAYADDHMLVGTVTFPVDARSGRVTQAVATERRATSVELVGCTAPGQNRPR